MKSKSWIFLIPVLLALASCQGGQTPAPLPTVVLDDNLSAMAATQASSGLDSNSSSVTASGVLVSDQHADLAFLASGNVKNVNVSVGQSVKEGDLLAALDDTLLKLQVDQANLALEELTSPFAISAAQKTLAEDQSALNQAQGTYNWWLEASSHQDLLDKAKADLVIANDALDKAQEDYDKLFADLYSDKDKAIAYQRLYEAQQDVKVIKARIAMYVVADPYQLAIYEANVEVAKAKLAGDQTLLAALMGGELPETPTGDAYTQLLRAQNNLKAAQASLANAWLVSPFDGVVAGINLHPGDFAAAGQIGITVIDPLHLHVETTDLSERDAPQVKVGQTVNVMVKPLNENVAGKVTAISPQADNLGGDVVYKVFISLDELPDGALPGMSVTVYFNN